MKKIDIGQTATILANVGVIVGIVFLAAEIRLNTRAIQAQTRDSIADKEMQLYAWQASNPELASVVRRAVFEGEESLDLDERQVLFAYLEAFFREHENALYQYEHGLFSRQEFEGRTRNMRLTLSSSAFLSHWESRRDLYSESMQAEIGRLVEATRNSD